MCLTEASQSCVHQEGVVVPERVSSQYEEHAVRVTKWYGLNCVPPPKKDILES